MSFLADLRRPIAQFSSAKREYFEVMAVVQTPRTEGSMSQKTVSHGQVSLVTSTSGCAIPKIVTEKM